MNQENKKFYSLTEAGRYMHIGRQGVYMAIRKGRLKSTMVNGRHMISQEDIDAYRASKYNRDLRIVDGQNLFDAERGDLSVNYVAKTFSKMLNKPYPLQRVYYLLRTGQIPGYKKGGTWVVRVEDAKALYDKESNRDTRPSFKQLMFA